MKKFCLISLLFISICDAGAQVQAVVTIGASTTYGMSASPSDSSWARRLHENLRSLVSFDTLHNLGVPGKDCYYAMPDNFIPPEGRPSPGAGKNVSAALRLLKYLEKPAQGIVIISYASNNYEKYSIEEILFCLKTIYNEVVSAGHQCLISTTQPRHDKYFESPAAKRKLAVIKDSIINRFGESSLNFYDGFFNPADSSILHLYAAGDEVHYNNAGHGELFRRVRNKINTLLSDAGAIASPFYPNPVEDRLLFEHDQFSSNTVIVVYDQLGRQIRVANVNDSFVDFSNLPAGLYVLKWMNRANPMAQRILKR